MAGRRAGRVVPTDQPQRPIAVAGLDGVDDRRVQGVPLLPGDVIFTGTPSGVGLGRRPQRFLAHGDTLTSHIEGIGAMTPRPTGRYRCRQSGPTGR